jgi:acyl-coenzyme A thioesterase PaaI-like protein
MRLPDRSVQETYAPHNACFGCGPSNPKGLRIRSFEQGDALVATWTPEPHHEAFPGVLNGGIIGSLLDCHCNWAAAMHLMKVRDLSSPPCTVTAEYAITLKRPCPTDGPLQISAKVVEQQGNRLVVEGTLEAQGKVRASCRGTFVAVEPGHPAYHRW